MRRPSSLKNKDKIMTWVFISLEPGEDRSKSGRLPELWPYPQELINQLKVNFGIDTSPKFLRFFPNFGVLGLLVPQDLDPEIFCLPEVASGIVPIFIEGSSDWYLNLLSAWDYLINRSANIEGIVVNLSLGLRIFDFDPDEPINRATRAASERGIVVVMAAGNFGEAGDDTLTSWARADWVISVGATDLHGQKVEPYSSRGLPDHLTLHPTIVAAGMQEPPSGSIGTSFAAPQVTDTVMFLEGFLLSLWKGAGRPVAELKRLFPRAIRNFLEQMALPMPESKPYACGAGFVSPERALEFMRSLTIPQLSGILPNNNWLTADLLTSVQDGLKMDALEFLGKSHLARIAVDTKYEWSRACFVPGLLQMKNYFLLRAGDRFERGEYFDLAAKKIGQAEFIEISILPHRLYARQLLVSKGKPDAFPSIGEAIGAANEWDIIYIEPGVYEEAFELKSGLTLIGIDRPVIRNSSLSPVILDEVKDVALINLEILTEGERMPAMLLINSRSIVLRNCKLVSQRGNALDGFASSRCQLDQCTLIGGINAAYLAFNSQFYITNSELTGSREGLFCYATSAVLSQCRVLGQNQHALTFIPPGPRWDNNKEQLLVYFHPMGKAIVQAVDVSPQSVSRNDVVGGLARIFYSLQANESLLDGNLAQIVASDFTQVLLSNCSTNKGISKYGIVKTPLPFPNRIPSNKTLDEVMRSVNNSLISATIEYFTPPTN